MLLNTSSAGLAQIVKAVLPVRRDGRNATKATLETVLLPLDRRPTSFALNAIERAVMVSSSNSHVFSNVRLHSASLMLSPAPLQLIFSVLKSLTGQPVTVELKNDLSVSGTLRSVDQ